MNFVLMSAFWNWSVIQVTKTGEKCCCLRNRSKKKRNPKVSEMEFQVILEEVVTNKDVLFYNHSTIVTNHSKMGGDVRKSQRRCVWLFKNSRWAVKKMVNIRHTYENRKFWWNVKKSRPKQTRIGFFVSDQLK